MNQAAELIQMDQEPLPHLRTMPGWVEVIAGSMFSGKSEELIRRLRRAKIARQKVQVFKPEVDSRYSNDHIVSHSEMRHESANIRNASRTAWRGSIRTLKWWALMKVSFSIMAWWMSLMSWPSAACA